jgi:hypothetical protein
MRTQNYVWGGLTAALGSWIGWSALSASRTPQPKYRVVEQKEDYEIREYEPYIVAETDVKGGFNEAMRKGFRRLFDYISGDNFKKNEITMAAPVVEKVRPGEITELAAGEVRTVAFTMPPGASIETLPLPSDASVRIRVMPARKVAARRFSLNPSQQRVERQEKELLNALERDNISTTDVPEFAAYNPPATFPFMKRNEILVGVH